MHGAGILSVRGYSREGLFQRTDYRSIRGVRVTVSLDSYVSGFVEVHPICSRIGQRPLHRPYPFVLHTSDSSLDVNRDVWDPKLVGSYLL